MEKNIVNIEIAGRKAVSRLDEGYSIRIAGIFCIIYDDNSREDCVCERRFRVLDNREEEIEYVEVLAPTYLKNMIKYDNKGGEEHIYIEGNNEEAVSSLKKIMEKIKAESRKMLFETSPIVLIRALDKENKVAKKLRYMDGIIDHYDGHSKK